ncbi:hypothetical protein Mal15_30050 [Stieleria maiorica]|uniref:Uncharacterized protein n=1 Tax=Stieleria maiorica TaxID=2795974 RepID=A0A5B9MIU4_9BACT|nr:hypothetical protein [Stieleria maiorica]QEF98947.1 hypothetical protein Mal15_30050 [Stieleria maiorica]
MTYQRGNHAVRSDRWWYIRYADGSEELYDHDADPNERTNLAGDNRIVDVTASHRRWLPPSFCPHRFAPIVLPPSFCPHRFAPIVLPYSRIPRKRDGDTVPSGEWCNGEPKRLQEFAVMR